MKVPHEVSWPAFDIAVAKSLRRAEVREHLVGYFDKTYFRYEPMELAWILRYVRNGRQLVIFLEDWDRFQPQCTLRKVHYAFEHGTTLAVGA